MVLSFAPASALRSTWAEVKKLQSVMHAPLHPPETHKRLERFAGDTFVGGTTA